MNIILDATKSQADKVKHIHECWQDLCLPRCNSVIISQSVLHMRGVFIRLTQNCC